MSEKTENAPLKGQLLIRSIVEEYRNVLEILEDPQVLMREDKSQTDLNLLRKSAPEVLQRLTSLFAQLTECYNDCLPDCPFDIKENGSTRSYDENNMQESQISHMYQGVQKKTDQLKNIINETRQLIWDIDKLKNH